MIVCLRKIQTSLLIVMLILKVISASKNNLLPHTLDNHHCHDDVNGKLIKTLEGPSFLLKNYFNQLFSLVFKFNYKLIYKLKLIPHLIIP